MIMVKNDRSHSAVDIVDLLVAILYGGKYFGKKSQYARNINSCYPSLKVFAQMLIVEANSVCL
jgi:hypothetical protein